MIEKILLIYPCRKNRGYSGRWRWIAVGVISGLAEGLPLRECVRRGNAIGTIQIMHEGDNTGLPTRQELELFLQTTPQED